MAVSSTFDVVPLGLGRALQQRGFEQLSAVQEAVLDPDHVGRDLRISSQTGSGKTVALGLVVAPSLVAEEPKRRRGAAPRALVIAPTRELAAQVGRELTWLYQPIRKHVVVVTGGTGIGGDFRALSRHPDVIVGTPGRLLDHIRRGTIDTQDVAAVVLDEADEMLDMGFRDELDGILEATPDTRLTHLVSATLPREVVRLADRYQKDPVRVAGSSPGVANAEISHIAHLVHHRDKLSALVNILLATPDEQTLVFVRTRVATTDVAAELSRCGFAAAPLSGEMGQRERNASLAAFREKRVRAIVATDVAARGLDIDDVARVVHFDLPEASEGYTHRSGRTGRAGRSGISVVLASPSDRRRLSFLASKAKIELTWQKVANASDIAQESGRRLIESIDAEMEKETSDPALALLAQSLLAGRDAETVVAHLLGRGGHLGPCEPRELIDMSNVDKPRYGDAKPRRGFNSRDDRRDSRDRNHDRARPARGGGGGGRGGPFVPFFVGWGAAAGANPSRLLAMVCRRGQIKGNQVGAIRIDHNRSVVEVASDVADDFARAASRRDARNPKIKITPWKATKSHQAADGEQLS